MKNNIGKIKKVSLREIWPKEDKDFTKWLEDNIDYLNDILDFEINIESSEESVGPFRVDLYGEDNYGRKIIVENQLEKTDHSHLGQIITYLTNLEINTAIWITKKSTKEHERAIEWLNEVTPNDISFYLIKVEAIRIGNESTAAPLFTIIKEPDPITKKIGEEKKDTAERDTLRKDFWTTLLEKAKDKTNLHSNIAPSKYHWIGTGAGKAGMGYNYLITNKRGACEIYFDKGRDFVEPNINKIRFDKLFQHKEEIEKKLEFKLNWERLNEKRASRISINFDDVGLKNREKWDGLQDKMIDHMIHLEKVFRVYINKL